MTINEYQKWTHTTAVYPNSAALTYLSLGLAGEAGEVANKVKKVIRDYREHPTLEERSKIVDELGDVLWYVAQISDILGVKLSEVIDLNQAKLCLRKENGTLSNRGGTK